MNIRKYRAVDMKSAIARIKADMGEDAVILSTKQVTNTNGAFGIFARPLIEITAVIDTEGKYKKKENNSRNDEQDNDQDTYNGNRQRRNISRRNQNVQRKSVPQKDNNNDLVSPLLNIMEPLFSEITELKNMISSTSQAEAIGRTDLKKAARISDELQDMKAMFGIMMEDSDFKKGLNLDTNYLLCYRKMLELGIEPQYALRLVQKVRDNVPGEREIDLKSIASEVKRNLTESLFIGEPIKPFAGGPRVVSLIGPTGVGKTTTVAKIAAELTLEGKKVGLITIDTYRIAAVEQLKIYAGILNIPLEVVLTPDELETAIAEFSSKDVIIIDTAGRSQRDSDKIDELSTFLSASDLIENYLVLSASSDSSVLDQSISNFGTIPITGLIFTKMDETLKPGVVISQNFKTGLPIAYLTNGQKVPEDIERASAGNIANSIFSKD